MGNWTRRHTIWLLALGLLTLVATAQAALVGIGSSSVQFRATGPGGLKIDGTGSGLTAGESGGELKVVAPLTNLKTGISLRDKHLKDAINADAHSKATLQVKRAALKIPANDQSVQGSARGSFTLNGVTKPVSFDYKASRTGSDYHVQGLATIDITRFNLEQPCYLGVCVDKEVKLKVKFKLREK